MGVLEWFAGAWLLATCQLRRAPLRAACVITLTLLTNLVRRQCSSSQIQGLLATVVFETQVKSWLNCCIILHVTAGGPESKQSLAPRD
jgi:hypothetical protein